MSDAEYSSRLQIKVYSYASCFCTKLNYINDMKYDPTERSKVNNTTLTPNDLPGDATDPRTQTRNSMKNEKIVKASYSALTILLSPHFLNNKGVPGTSAFANLC